MTHFEHVPGIDGLCIATPSRHGDDRGFFAETYHQERYQSGGIRPVLVQDNHSRSRQKGTIRGLHFQKPPRAQAKLVSCVRGRILDVAVDIRTGSPSFGRHFSIELSPSNGRQLYVPAGFAHGFCTLEDETEILYKVSDYYAPECDAGLAFDDPDLAIEWPIFENGWVLSERDRRFPKLSDLTEPIFSITSSQAPDQ